MINVAQFIEIFYLEIYDETLTGTLPLHTLKSNINVLAAKLMSIFKTYLIFNNLFLLKYNYSFKMLQMNKLIDIVLFILHILCNEILLLLLQILLLRLPSNYLGSLLS